MLLTLSCEHNGNKKNDVTIIINRAYMCKVYFINHLEYINAYFMVSNLDFMLLRTGIRKYFHGIITISRS